MNHSWRATKVRPFEGYGVDQQIFTCKNCGFEAINAKKPDDDEKMPYQPPGAPNEVWYCTCEQLVVLSVMDS